MKHALPTATRVEAYAASALRALAWLLGVVLRLGASGRSARLQQMLSRLERSVECILFLKAVARYGPPPPRRHRPRSTPRGFGRVEGGRLRLFYRGCGARARKAGVLTRVLALINALAHPERAIDYFFKRICRGLHLSRLVPVAPPAAALHGNPPGAISFADSS